LPPTTRSPGGWAGDAARQHALLEDLSQSVFLKDRDLRFVAANAAFCRGLGRPPEDVLGRDDFAFYPRELAEKYRADDRRVLAEGERFEADELNWIDGKARTVRVVKTPVHGPDGAIDGVLGIFWDVTAQRRLETQLRQAQKMEAVGRLAGGIAHDFNNLLAAILGNVSLALAELPPESPCRELLAGCETAGLRAAELTRQLLGYARQMQPRAEPFDLNAAVRERADALERAHDPELAVEVRTAPDLWRVLADPSQLGQVLLSLCRNAQDAMPGGGLTLETANVTLDGDAALLHPERRPGEFVRLGIADTGAGIAPEVLPRLFEPFFTTKDFGKGSGLGLAMTYGILKEHAGWVECRSEAGRGTHVDVYLPRLAASAEPLPACLTAGVPGGSETVLLADEQEVFRRLGQDILERCGYQVLTADSEVQAVEVYRRRHQDIQLVILDLRPRGSAEETLRELRRINPGVSVLLSAGHPTPPPLRAVDCGGALGFVARPYRPAELARGIRTALDRGRATVSPGGH
jgi:PAS domain S-box-containing protein